MGMTEKMLPICKANELLIRKPEHSWLIQPLWANHAVGILGGPPKTYKSWMGLDMAVSVASATLCLNTFQVKQPGTALIFMAEDDLSAVRARIKSLCDHRKIDIDSLDLYVITASSLRLDLDHDQKLLQTTLDSLKPRLLLLDPLVRLHRRDENSASEISTLLGFLRQMQRAHGTAIVLVHHAGKRRYAQPGQALRGSSDLHAFGDSNMYTSYRKDRIFLTVEHRAAKSPQPIELKLKAQPDESAAHLEIVSEIKIDSEQSLENRTLTLLKHEQNPMTRSNIRKHLKVNNQRLGNAISSLQQKGLILKTTKGWLASDGKRQSITQKKESNNDQDSVPKQCSLPF